MLPIADLETNIEISVNKSISLLNQRRNYSIITQYCPKRQKIIGEYI